MRTEVVLPGDFTLAHVDAILLELAGGRQGPVKMPYLAVGGRRRVAGELLPRSVHVYRRLGTAQALARRLDLTPDMASYMHGDHVVDFWWDEHGQVKLVLVGEAGPVIDALRRIHGDAARVGPASDVAVQRTDRGVEETAAITRRSLPPKAPRSVAPVAAPSTSRAVSKGSAAQPGARPPRPTVDGRRTTSPAQRADANAGQRAEKPSESRELKRFVTSVSAAVVAGIILRALGF
jgi:hypothetical protein